ncbi:MAG: hypothetical protein ACRD5Z_23105, partial [Bryobacteraceae bacterium]
TLRNGPGLFPCALICTPTPELSIERAGGEYQTRATLPAFFALFKFAGAELFRMSSLAFEAMTAVQIDRHAL